MLLVSLLTIEFSSYPSSGDACGVAAVTGVTELIVSL